MRQRVVVITGASSGIGLETAKAFAALGWHVIGQGRNPERSAAADTAIRAAASSDAKIDFLHSNLSLMVDTSVFAETVKALTGTADVLINNAGGVRDKRYVTSEGLEETFSGNYLSAFLLTRQLMPLLESAQGARVLNTSSLAYHSAQPFEWDDLQHLKGEFHASPAYCQVKLMNALFTLELNQRIAGKGMLSHALIPGVVLTNFASHGDQGMQSYLKTATGLTPAEVAQCLLWMATAPETGLPGGRHFYEMQEQPIAPNAADQEGAARLWLESEKILASLGY